MGVRPLLVGAYAVVLALLGAARGFGLITPDQAGILEPIILGAGMAALRAATPGK